MYLSLLPETDEWAAKLGAAAASLQPWRHKIEEKGPLKLVDRTGVLADVVKMLL